MLVEYVMTNEVLVQDMNAFRRLHPGVVVVRVDGKECFGECSKCYAPILGGTTYMVWADGKKTCEECNR